MPKKPDVVVSRPVDTVSIAELNLALFIALSGYSGTDWQYDMREIARSISQELGVDIRDGVLDPDISTPENSVLFDGHDFWLEGNELVYRVHPDISSEDKKTAG